MDPVTAKLMSAAGAAEDPIYVDDVFSTFLYEGNGSTGQTINNGIDLSGEGGMVWIKDRDAANNHAIYDTERGVQKLLKANEDHAEDNSSTGTKDLHQFNSNGFSIGEDNAAYLNTNNNSHCSWTFRKCPGFFDIVTYTGNGTSGRTIAHSLGSVPGCIMVKRRSDSADWAVYHRANEGFFASDPVSNLHLHLNQNHTAQGSSAYWNDTDPTSSVFTVGNSNDVNQNGETYVAYLFAHDDQSFGDGGDEAIIKCGSYTGTGSFLSVDLGFEPQWLLIKKTQTATATWVMWDTMRGFTASGINDKFLKANESSAEGTYSSVGITPTGFQVESGDSNTNNSGDNVIYIAIRRPHKPPSAGTDVFAIDTKSAKSANTPSYTTNFSVDFALRRNNITSTNSVTMFARLTATERFLLDSTAAATTDATFDDHFKFNNGYGDFSSGDSNDYGYFFKRAPGFFDVVVYKGASGAQTINHNLGVTPGLIIIKKTSEASYYPATVYHGTTGNLLLNDFSSGYGSNNAVNHSNISATTFEVKSGSGDVNDVGETHIAYLFASLTGISKVGSYSGSSSDVTVDCGFTNGARFVVIKRTNGSGEWFLYDSVRGLTTNNDPYLRLDNTAAQATESENWVESHSSGFKVNSANISDLNGSGNTYFFLAIA